MLRPISSTLDQTAALLHEILMVPSNKVINDRFSALELTEAGCGSACGAGCGSGCGGGTH